MSGSLTGVVRAADMALRWGGLKARINALRSEREDCATDDVPCRERSSDSSEDEFDFRALAFAEWCGECQRNEARYRLRLLLQRKLRDVQRRMLALSGATDGWLLGGQR